MKRCIVVMLSLLFAYMPKAFASEKIPVFVSIVPQIYFAEKIGIERLEHLHRTDELEALT